MSQALDDDSIARLHHATRDTLDRIPRDAFGRARALRPTLPFLRGANVRAATGRDRALSRLLKKDSDG